MFLFYTGLHWYFVGWSRIQILNQISMFSIWWSEFTEADLSTGSPSLKYLATKTYYWKRKRKLFLVGSSSVGRLNLPPTQPYPIPRLASRDQTFQKKRKQPDQRSTINTGWNVKIFRFMENISQIKWSPFWAASYLIFVNFGTPLQNLGLKKCTKKCKNSRQNSQNWCEKSTLVTNISFGQPYSKPD